MMTTSSVSLQSFNTFGLSVFAEQILIANTIEQLCSSWSLAKSIKKPFLLLGEGSNILFLSDFAGIVVLNRLMGKLCEEDKDNWYLHIASGENWHELVRYCLNQGVNGLENLALIPGCVGSAPIQNIGAYGVELKNFCNYVDVLNLASGDIQRINAVDCQFGYRESIFKHQYKEGNAIVSVGLVLPKLWTPRLEYGELRALDRESVTAKQIFDVICQTRKLKLPDPKITGSAGSFFKNPVVDSMSAKALLSCWPDMPHYLQTDGMVKLAAGWLIDQCQMKGYTVNGAAVHQKQALVLINSGNAVSDDVVEVARHVREQVMMKFSISLEPEVRFIGRTGECNALEILA